MKYDNNIFLLIKYWWFDCRDIIRWKIGKIFFNRKSHILTYPSNKIVFYRADGKIGDSIIFSTLLKSIITNNLDLTITIITTESLRQFVPSGIKCDYLISKSYNKLSYRQIYLLAKKIGAVKYFVNLDTNLKLKGYFFMSHVQAETIFGGTSANFIDINLYQNAFKKHMTEIYRDLLTFLGGSSFDINYHLPSSPAIELDFLNYIAQRKYIVINAFAAGSDRSLNASSLQKVIDVIQHKYSDIFIIPIYSPSTRDIVKSICNDKVLFYPNIQSINHSIEILRHAEFVVTVDTAIVHISEGLNKRLFAIYNSPDNEFYKWHPIKNSTTTIRSRTRDLNKLTWLEELEQRL